jgi:hypothetical protein
VSTLNGPTGPLGRGWHRIIWDGGKYVVTDSVTSMVEVHTALRDKPGLRLESWSDYPHDPATGGYGPAVSRETVKET